MKTNKGGNIEALLEIARSGSPEQIATLVRLPNPRIQEEIINNFSVPPELIIIMIRARRLSPGLLNLIHKNKRFIREYKVRLELVLNPSTPRAVTLRLIKDFHQDDLAKISRDITLHPAVRTLADNYLKIRLASMRIGERISLAKIATPALLRLLMIDPDQRVVETCLSNYRLGEADVVRYANDTRAKGEKLDLIVQHPRWSAYQSILTALSRNPNIHYASLRIVYEKIRLPLLIKFIHSPNLDENKRKLARFVAQFRLKKMPEEDQLLLASSHSKITLRELLVSAGNSRVISKLLSNRRLTEEDVVFFLQKNKYTGSEKIVGGHPRWKENSQIKKRLDKFTKDKKIIDGCFSESFADLDSKESTGENNLDVKPAN